MTKYSIEETANVTLFDLNTGKIVGTMENVSFSVNEEKEVTIYEKTSQIVEDSKSEAEVILKYLNLSEINDLGREIVWQDVVDHTNGEGISIMKMYNYAKYYLKKMEAKKMKELNTYSFTRYFVGGHEYTWKVQATETEIKKLAQHELNERPLRTIEVKYHIDNNLEVTHHFDSNGRLWCRTPIVIR